MKTRLLGKNGKILSQDSLFRGIFLGVNLGLLYFLARMILISAVAGTDWKNIIRIALVLAVLNLSKKTFWFIAFPYVSFHAAYLPIAEAYGAMNPNYFASIFETNVQETREFLSGLSIEYVLLALTMVVGIVLFRITAVRFDLQIAKNKVALVILVMISVMSLAPYQLPRNILDSAKNAYAELKVIKELQKVSDWKITAVNPKYDVYVLIVGESARKDYMEAYGYPVNNTPFMSNSPGVLVNGLTAGGMNTIASLRLMLTNPDKGSWKPRYDLSLIDLANDAGFQTVWISNQGFLGIYDTPISSLADKSQKKIFLKKGNFDSKNTDDESLIQIFREQLTARDVTRKTLIVLHVYGSHPNACDRLHEFRNRYVAKTAKYNNLGCYLASLEKTDHILKEINDILKEFSRKEHESYSLLYFSDHGVAQKMEDDVWHMKHMDIREDYDVPLFKVSSDDLSRKELKSYKSPLDFVNGLSNWMGVEAVQLNKEYSLFDGRDDPDYGQKEKLNALPSESALDIRKYLKDQKTAMP